MPSTKTDFVSCPSCGRASLICSIQPLKSLKRLGHLPSVTVAVMGCIVNRPGESTDADYRYAGSIYGKIDLYCGEEVVRKKVLESETVDELFDFIINID